MFFVTVRVFRFARLGDGPSSAEIELALKGDICAVFDAAVSLCEKLRIADMVVVAMLGMILWENAANTEVCHDS